MKHIQHIIRSSFKGNFYVKSVLYHFTDLSPNHTLDLFDMLIRPILCYGALIWGFSKPVQQESVHLQFCKQMLGVKKCTQNDFVYGELGRVSMQNGIFIQ